MSEKAAQLIVRGMVQGVWFRASAEKAAGQHGVSGWVRNCPDGTVEIFAEGTQQGVEAFIHWCRGGPPLARVEAVDVDWVDPVGMTRFEVR